MHFLSESLESYIDNHSQGEPELLWELSRETHLKVVQPRMITGHYQGRVLSLLSKLICPQYVLEIGTYTGYSALCLAEGLGTNGYLHTIDINEELHEMQRKYFDKSAYAERIIQHTGNALDIIPKMDLIFDLVFIDAEKTEYPKYLNLVLDKIKVGSVILSDNVLWSGKVLDKAPKNDRATIVLKEYNQLLKDHPQLETVILPVRDGLSLSRVL
ncbi:MAG: O-methyltransferase [Flavobacteriaceae bacterium]